jgi:hypothetical protein
LAPYRGWHGRVWSLSWVRFLGLLMLGLGQYSLLGNAVVSLCGASGNTLYWILLLVYMGPRATHFTGYCCWFMWGLGQHTLLGIGVGSCGALGNTLYCILILVYVGARATHFIVVGFYEISDNTLNWASLFVCYGSSAMGLNI